MIILLLILSLFVADVAKAATYWVHPSGNNGACTNTTTPQGAGGNAKTTIAAGVACLSSGDTLNIRAGTYNENVLSQGQGGTIMNAASGSAPTGWGTSSWSPSGMTTVQAYCSSNCNTPIGSYGPAGGAEVVLLNGTFNFGAGNHSYWLLKNFKVFNESDGIYMGGGATVNHLKLDGMDVSGTNGSDRGDGNPVSSRAVGITGPDMWITHTRVHNSKAGVVTALLQCHCYYVESDRTLIEYSTCHDWYVGVGIHHYTGATALLDNVIRYNVFRNIVGGGGAGVSWNGTNTQWYGNLMYDNDNGVSFQGCTNCAFYNNTVYNNQNSNTNPACCYPVIQSSSPSDLALAKNNIVYNNLLNSIVSTPSGTSNNLFSNPSFANVSTGDFHLQSGSSAIGAGVNLSSVFTTDITGASWPGSGAWDIGAYKSGAAPPVGGGPVVTITSPPNSGSVTVTTSTITLGGTVQ